MHHREYFCPSPDCIVHRLGDGQGPKNKADPIDSEAGLDASAASGLKLSASQSSATTRLRHAREILDEYGVNRPRGWLSDQCSDDETSDQDAIPQQSALVDGPGSNRPGRDSSSGNDEDNNGSSDDGLDCHACGKRLERGWSECGYCGHAGCLRCMEDTSEEDPFLVHKRTFSRSIVREDTTRGVVRHHIHETFREVSKYEDESQEDKAPLQQEKWKSRVEGNKNSVAAITDKGGSSSEKGAGEATSHTSSTADVTQAADKTSSSSSLDSSNASGKDAHPKSSHSDEQRVVTTSSTKHSSDHLVAQSHTTSSKTATSSSARTARTAEETRGVRDSPFILADRSTKAATDQVATRSNKCAVEAESPTRARTTSSSSSSESASVHGDTHSTQLHEVQQESSRYEEANTKTAETRNYSAYGSSSYSSSICETCKSSSSSFYGEKDEEAVFQSASRESSEEEESRISVSSDGSQESRLARYRTKKADLELPILPHKLCRDPKVQTSIPTFSHNLQADDKSLVAFTQLRRHHLREDTQIAIARKDTHKLSRDPKLPRTHVDKLLALRKGTLESVSNPSSVQARGRHRGDSQGSVVTNATGWTYYSHRHPQAPSPERDFWPALQRVPSDELPPDFPRRLLRSARTEGELRKRREEHEQMTFEQFQDSKEASRASSHHVAAQASETRTRRRSFTTEDAGGSGLHRALALQVSRSRSDPGRESNHEGPSGQDEAHDIGEDEEKPDSRRNCWKPFEKYGNSLGKGELDECTEKNEKTSSQRTQDNQELRVESSSACHGPAKSSTQHRHHKRRHHHHHHHHKRKLGRRRLRSHDEKQEETVDAEKKFHEQASREERSGKAVERQKRHGSRDEKQVVKLKHSSAQATSTPHDAEKDPVRELQRRAAGVVVDRGVNADPLPRVVLEGMTTVLHFKGMDDVVIDEVLNLEVHAVS